MSLVTHVYLILELMSSSARVADAWSLADEDESSPLSFATQLQLAIHRHPGPRYLLVLIYTPKEAHSRIFVTGGSIFARQMLAKKKSITGSQFELVVVHFHLQYITIAQPTCTVFQYFSM